MKLLILIVVMVLERFWNALDDMRADRAIENQVLSIRDRLSKALGTPLTLGLIWILFPLLIAWFMSSLGSSLFGLLIYLLISIAVLLLLLAPRQINQQATALHEACEHEDEAGAALCRAKLAEGTSLNAETATPQQLAERIITLGFHEWFAVLFWFVVLGPAGAVFYRLTDWLAQPVSAESGKPNWLSKMLAVFDWPVVRVYAALLLLAGGFNRGLGAWINGGGEEAASLAEKNAALVGRVGHAALELEREDDCGDGEACLADESRWYKNASALVLRALMIGLGLVALLTLSGWVE